MKNITKTLSLILALVMLLLAIASCANHEDDIHNNDGTTDSTADNAGNSSDTDDSANKESGTDNSDTTPPEATDPILSDLNNDGTDDQIIITYDNAEKSSATIKVINGKDASELMSDKLKLDANKFGAYYLQRGKSNYPDKLVFWYYNYLNNEKIAFTYYVFSYDPDGKIVYGDKENKTFDIGPDASLASANIPFGVMVEAINENIRENDIEYEAYLLIDNHNGAIVASTKDNMLDPSKLEFSLENFVKQSGGDETTDSSDKNDQASSEMAIEEGYTVLATETLTIPVTIDKVKVNHTARVAALRNAEGKNALYFDVLSADNKVMTSITWKGCYQLFLNSEGVLILMRTSINPTNKNVAAVYQLFDVSDTKYSNYDVIELETPQINSVPGEGESLNFTVGSDAAMAMYAAHYENLMHGFQYALEGDVKAGRDVYMIAECYLNPETPTVYSDKAKMPFPNFEEKEIVDKYTLSYAASLFE